VFDKAELSKTEQRVLKNWAFVVPPEEASFVDQKLKETGGDTEIILTFDKSVTTPHIYKGIIPIPPCSLFRYFEVEVLENRADCAIYLGIIESKDFFAN
jgi:hypothetical protein